MIATGAPYAGHHLNATSDDQLGRQALHHLVSLIARQASHSRDATIWSGSRRPNLQVFTCPDDTASERQATFNQKAHRDRSSVPAARLLFQQRDDAFTTAFPCSPTAESSVILG